ncbi:MAG: MATE family efflux transporter [Dehalococcoidia bacterium]
MLSLAIDERHLNRSIVNVAWPIAIAHLSLALLTAIDGVLVGQFVGKDALAGVGLGALVLWLPQAGSLGLSTGATTVTSWDIGANAASRLGRTINASVALGALWGVLVSAMVAGGAGPIMTIMGLEGQAHTDGANYLRAAGFSLLGFSVFEAASGVLRGAGHTRTPMVIIIGFNLLNAALTFVLISGYFGLELGTAGAGIGSTIGALAGATVALAVLARGSVGVPWRLREATSVPVQSARRVLGLSVPVALEEAQFMLAFLAYARIITSVSTEATAAHAAALRTLDLIIMPAFAMGLACTALVGQALGARRVDLAERLANRTRNISLAVMISLATVGFFVAPHVPRVFTDDPEVLREAGNVLRIFVLAVPALSLSTSMSGALRGAGDVRFVLLIMTVTAWGVRVPAAFVGARVFEWGLVGAWLGAVLEVNVRGILTWLRFRSGQWKHRTV